MDGLEFSRRNGKITRNKILSVYQVRIQECLSKIGGNIEEHKMPGMNL